MSIPPPTEAQWQGFNKLLNTFYNRVDAEPFRAPVDWKALGLYDYPQIIKKPMDLGTIKKTLAASSKSHYSTIHAAAADVRLVWTNCMTYNADGSDFFMLALTLQKKWDEKLSKFMTDFQVIGPGTTMTAASSSAGNDKVTLEDKKAFAKSLFKLTKEDLGKIIVEIDTKSPGALTKNATEDECEINVDKIPAHLLGELRAFVASCSSSTTSNNSSSAAAAAQPPKKKKKQ